MDITFSKAKKIIVLLFALFFIHNNSKASDKENFIMHHLKDDYTWHITSIGDHKDIVLYLPIITLSKSRGLEIFSSAKIETENG